MYGCCEPIKMLSIFACLITYLKPQKHSFTVHHGAYDTLQKKQSNNSYSNTQTVCQQQQKKWRLFEYNFHARIQKILS